MATRLQRIADWLGVAYSEAELQEAELAMSSAASRVLAYEIGVAYIARALTRCEVQVLRDGKPVKDELYYALNVSPNPNQSGSEFMTKLVQRYYHDGSALMVQPFRRRNWFYIADSYGVDERPLGRDRFTSVNVRGQQLAYPIRAGDACRFQMHEGRLMRALDEAMRSMEQLLQASRNAFERDSGERYLFKTEGRPGGTREDERAAKDEVNDRLRAFVRGTNLVLPLNRGQEIERVAKSTASSADSIDLRKDIFELTGQALGIPVSMMQGNMTNSTEIVGQFLTLAVDPLAEEISDEMTRCLFPYEAWDHGKNRVAVDTSMVNHLDLFAVSDDVSKLIGSGTTSIDEMRAKLPGLWELGTEFSTAHWMTKNNSEAQAALDMLDDGKPGGGE